MHSHNQYLQAALGEAFESTMNSRHGAVLIEGHRIVVSGHNSNDRAWIKGRIQLPSTHAELACARRLPNQGFEGGKDR